MLAGVGPFAIEAGMVAATAPETRVRIHNVNTGKLIEAIVQTPGGAVTYEGEAAIDGVPGTAAPIRLSFLDAAGAKTGRLLPTGRARDRIGGLEATLHRHGDADGAPARRRPRQDRPREPGRARRRRRGSWPGWRPSAARRAR